MSVIFFSLQELQAALTVCSGVPGMMTDGARRGLAEDLARISEGNAAQWNRTYQDKVGSFSAEQIQSAPRGALPGSPLWNMGMGCIRSMAYNIDGARDSLARVQQLALYAAMERISEQQAELIALRSAPAPSKRRAARSR